MLEIFLNAKFIYKKINEILLSEAKEDLDLAVILLDVNSIRPDQHLTPPDAIPTPLGSIITPLDILLGSMIIPLAILLNATINRDLTMIHQPTITLRPTPTHRRPPAKEAVTEFYNIAL